MKTSDIKLLASDFSSIIGMPIMTSPHLSETKTITQTKRWKRAGRPDKVRVRSRVVNRPIAYIIRGTIYMHPDMLKQLSREADIQAKAFNDKYGRLAEHMGEMFGKKVNEAMLHTIASQPFMFNGVSTQTESDFSKAALESQRSIFSGPAERMCALPPFDFRG